MEKDLEALSVLTGKHGSNWLLMFAISTWLGVKAHASCIWMWTSQVLVAFRWIQAGCPHSVESSSTFFVTVPVRSNAFKNELQKGIKPEHWRKFAISFLSHLPAYDFLLWVDTSKSSEHYTYTKTFPDKETEVVLNWEKLDHGTWG